MIEEPSSREVCLRKDLREGARQALDALAFRTRGGTDSSPERGNLPVQGVIVQGVDLPHGVGGEIRAGNGARVDGVEEITSPGFPGGEGLQGVAAGFEIGKGGIVGEDDRGCAGVFKAGQCAQGGPLQDRASQSFVQPGSQILGAGFHELNEGGTPLVGRGGLVFGERLQAREGGGIAEAGAELQDQAGAARVRSRFAREARGPVG